MLAAFLLVAHREALILSGCRYDTGILWWPRSLLVRDLPLTHTVHFSLGTRKVTAALAVLDDRLNVLSKVRVQDL